jgi:tetratricopeptide (TPR) repeat protein
MKNPFATIGVYLCHKCRMRFIFKYYYKRYQATFVSVLMVAGIIGSTFAQMPLLGHSLNETDTHRDVLFDWKLQSAAQALEVGLASIALGLYDDLLSIEPLADETIANLMFLKATAYIAGGDFYQAREALESVAPNARGSRYWLHWSVANYGDGLNIDIVALRMAYAKVDISELIDIDLAWYYLLGGLLDEASNKEDDVVEAAWIRAQSAAISDTQAAFFHSLILRQKLFGRGSNDSLATEMRIQLDRLEGVTAITYAKEYAVLLHRMQRVDEAVAVIDKELEDSSANYGDIAREQLRLLRAMIIGEDTPEGQIALMELIRSGRDRLIMEVALQLLARTEDTERDFSDFLNEMISRSEPHSLLPQLYYLRCQLALFNGDLSVAEADASILLEQFPGMSQIENVYQLLAYAALQRSPAQYRTAADLLTQLRDQSDLVAQTDQLNMWIGDCYFLNKDYENAADFYQASNRSDRALSKELFLRIVTAEVRSGDLEAALRFLDITYTEPSYYDTLVRWQAEWNVAQALQSQGKVHVARDRLRLLFESGTDQAVPVTLDLRLRWLDARLRLLLGETDGLVGTVETLLLRLQSLPSGLVAGDEVKVLMAELVLLTVEALFHQGDTVRASEELLRLREDYPQSDCSERSYLIEAAYHGSVGNYSFAQQTLLTLSTRFPGSPLVAQSIFEAALYCEKRGVDLYADAVRLYNELVERFPEDPLLFTAQLKQGDLLRKMNDFAGAQIIYETLIYTYPNHPQRYAAELARAECLLAIAKNDATQIEAVASILERLMDLPNVPVDFMMEIAYKWAFALNASGRSSEAGEVYFMSIERYLLNSISLDQLGVTGRYWASRALLDLGTLLEKNGSLLEARKIYLKLQAYNLPGRKLAETRISNLPSTN